LAALKEYRPLIIGSPHEIIVKTDHLSLTFLSSLKNERGKLYRFSVLLQEFRLKFCHIAGKKLFVDHLSRREYAVDGKNDSVVELDTNTHDYLFNIDIFEPDDRPIRRKFKFYRLIQTPGIISPVQTHGGAKRAAPAPASSPLTADPSCAAPDPPIGVDTHDISTPDVAPTGNLSTSADVADSFDLMTPHDAAAAHTAALNVTGQISLDQQRDDEFFRQIIEYLEMGLLPKERHKIHTLLSQIDDYFIEHNRLYHLAIPRGKNLHLIR
jgi:hypothetical protein